MAVTKTYRSIIAKINNHIKKNSTLFVDYGRWYIGITHDVAERKAAHTRTYGELYYFKSYYAYSMEIASSIEDFLTKKGTLNKLGSRGATKDSKYVYVFKARPTIAD